MSLTTARVHITGIRHLSPIGAYQLRRQLDEIKPTAVLIEGPADANEQIQFFAAHGTVPPVAILAYTEELPIRTLLYPFAAYSPELQAILWALKAQAHVEFIDLPSSVMIALERPEEWLEQPQEPTQQHTEKPLQQQSELSANDSQPVSIYTRIAQLAGEDSYESYWEKHFEHQRDSETYVAAINHFARELRGLSEADERVSDRWEYARNLVRESFMRRQIRQALDNGHAPEKIVVVTGAYHASALTTDLPIMSDRELASLPRKATKLTLMPYSYYKLSSKSGYGAGNEAPAYFESMWECLQTDDLERLPAYYMTSVATHLRDSGTFRSTAEVMEGVRLAQSLAGLKGGTQPALADLRDAAMIALGQGELSIIAEAVARTETGTAVGTLPEGVSKTPVQDDFYRELKRLKLEKYRTVVATELELDLRENRRVKSVEAAYIDLHRSFFLHRLEVLGIRFAKKRSVHSAAVWAEHWHLQWVPETEIDLVESTLLGETVRLAAAYVMKEKLEQCTSVGEASALIRRACECGMPEALELARQKLQALAVDAYDFQQIAEAVNQLALVIGFGDIRQFDVAPLVPILQQLFLRGTLLLVDAATCNAEVAKTLVGSVQLMQQVSREHYELVDSQLWQEKVAELSARDDRNPLLSGYACSLLVERNQLSNEELAKEVSRRLSPGIPADLGAGWFEGLALRNPYALLSRLHLWEQLDDYIASLDESQFTRALVFLRRAFTSFSPSEKARAAELLGEIWQIDPEAAGEALQQELTEQEQEMLDSLNDFDFGDL